MNSDTYEIPLEHLGPAGIQGDLAIVHRFHGDTRIDTDRLNDTTERMFVVFGRLSRTSELPPGIVVSFSPDDGGSNLIVPEWVLHSHVSTARGTFEVAKNKNGELSLIRYDCRALSVTSAKALFFDEALPWLDFLSFEANCPIFILQVRVEDPSNNVIVTNCRFPHRNVIINPHRESLVEELLPVYAMYREAKNAGSDFYKFLCYYKIIEGLLGKMRSDIYRRAKDSGVKLPRSKDCVPDHAEISNDIRPFIGKSIKNYFDKYLTPRFRNSVAHLVTDDGATLHMSYYEDIMKYSAVVFSVELCCRELIRTHEDIVKQLIA